MGIHRRRSLTGLAAAAALAVPAVAAAQPTCPFLVDSQGTVGVGGVTHTSIQAAVDDLPNPGPCVVGFFGDRRPHVDAWPLEEANNEIVGEFSKYPGILAYCSVELPERYWANLVLHDDPVDVQFWRTSEMHARAVETLSPKHYFNVRIHNGVLTSGIFEKPQIVIRKTKYFDYTGPELWRAERLLGPA